ncbi:MAG: N-acetylmuramoyl-L-alanine amidase [Coriobacteriales bacterium]|jgi:hypothetical protein|nr:N-acetylmuramoyl-L-alanine amidase [Coriobacteriales bacterium]
MNRTTLQRRCAQALVPARGPGRARPLAALLAELTLLAELALLALAALLAVSLVGCGPDGSVMVQDATSFDDPPTDSRFETPAPDATAESPAESPEIELTEEPMPTPANAAALFQELGVVEDYRPEFVHGEKPAQYQKYIVLHDTEGWGDPASVIAYWDGRDNGVAAHFVIGTDGSVFQCVPLDAITHHAGWADTGKNALYGVEDESRDDKVGTAFYATSYTDYGMNSYSIGIEMVHVGGDGDYPQAQLDALDKVIAYIDAWYGFESTIIDHKAWAAGNSDTSAEFAGYLANYQDHRSWR